MTFTDSYIALCREHPMDREFVLGDWVHYFDRSLRRDSVDVLAFDDNRDPDRTAAGVYWLPRLDQLLDLLAKFAFPDLGEICLYGDQEIGYSCEAEVKGNRLRGEGSSREEAVFYVLRACGVII